MGWAFPQMLSPLFTDYTLNIDASGWKHTSYYLIYASRTLFVVSWYWLQLEFNYYNHLQNNYLATMIILRIIDNMFRVSHFSLREWLSFSWFIHDSLRG